MSATTMTDGNVFQMNGESPRVTHEGRDLGFTVKDMMPERRWAVNEMGQTIHRLEFMDRYKTMVSSRVKNETPELVSVPNQIDYISQTRNELGAIVPIGWDASMDDPIEVHRPGVTAGALTPEEAARRDAGEAFRAKATAQDAQIDLVMGMVDQGIISAEIGMRQIASIRGKAATGPEAAPLETTYIAETEDGPVAPVDPIAEPVRKLHLAPQERRVWELREKTDQEIADLMGIKKSTVAVYRMKAKKKMEASA